MKPRNRAAVGGKAQGPRTAVRKHIGWAPVKSKHQPHVGAKQLAKAAKRAANETS